MCGGINHGVGEMQARQNCSAMGVAWIERTKRLPYFKKRRPFVPEQGSLFADAEPEWDGSPVSDREAVTPQF
jgi:hypothetical protein